MDLDDFRSFISDSGVDVWTWIDMAISVASADHEDELKNRRDGIIQKLYEPAFSKCSNCGRRETERNGGYEQREDVGFDCDAVETPAVKTVADNEDEDDDEQRKILEIKVLLDDQNQSERSLTELLQRLVEMDTTFKTLKETDIGRHVTKLRKHSSTEVRRLVKILVRKWKDTVDEWVRLNTPMEEEEDEEEEEDVAQFNGLKAQVLHHTDSQKAKVKHNQIDFASSGDHLHDQNYQDAKKQRAMDFHNIPKLKNSIISSNGGGVPVKYW